jgi:hypothetical protein
MSMGSILFLAPSEMSKTVSLGLLQGFMGVIPIVIEDTYGWTWLACLVDGIYLGALRGDFNVTRFSSERSGEARFSPAMMEFSNCTFELGLMDLPLGKVIEYLPLGQELINFSFLRIGKLSFPIYLRKWCIDCAQTTFPFSLIVVFREEKNLLILRRR